jgi:hypothetical protein
MATIARLRETGEPPVGRKQPATTRVQRYLLLLGAAWTGVTSLFCAWLQHATMALLGTAAVVLTALLLERARFPGPVIGRSLNLVTLLCWVAGFYRLLGPGIDTLALGILLVVLVFGSLYYGLVCCVVWIDAWRKWVPQIVFAVGSAIVAFVAADLLFVGASPLQALRCPSYHPFLTYSLDGSYVFAHAREQHVSDMQGVEFQQKKQEGVTRIVLNGASTMFDRIPGNLTVELRRLYPDRRFEVLCTCYPGKYQLNELIDSTVSIPHWHPDLVISINGFNEIWYGEDENYYEGMPYVEGQMRTVGTANSLFARFSHFGASRFAQQAAAFMRNSPFRLRKELDYEPPRYYSYLRLTARNLKQFDIPYVYTFCPNLVEKTHLADGEKPMLDLAETWPRLVPERRRESQRILHDEGQINYDIMAILDVEEQVFRDECHLNEHGVRIVSEDLARRIPNWIKTWALHSSE